MISSATLLALALKQQDCPVTGFAGGASLDLFTEKGGSGVNASGGVFCAGCFIALYANVTYNGDGVADVLVSYEVRNPLNHPMVYSTARSDLHGIARINFTIPSAPLEEVLGNWTAVATASVAQRFVIDWITFQVIEDPPFPGDANLDGRVNILDATLLCMAWRSKIGDPNYNPNCDFNKDGEINIEDTAIMSTNWGQTG